MFSPEDGVVVNANDPGAGHFEGPDRLQPLRKPFEGRMGLFLRDGQIVRSHVPPVSLKPPGPLWVPVLGKNPGDKTGRPEAALGAPTPTTSG